MLQVDAVAQTQPQPLIFPSVFPLFSSLNSSRPLPSVPSPTNNRAEYCETTARFQLQSVIFRMHLSITLRIGSHLPLTHTSYYIFTSHRPLTAAMLLALEQVLTVDPRCSRQLCVCGKHSPASPSPLPLQCLMRVSLSFAVTQTASCC